MGHRRAGHLASSSTRGQTIKPTEFDLRKDAVSEIHIFEERLRHRRLDEGRCDGVDPDTMTCQVNRHRLRESFHRPFRCAVERPIGATNMAHMGWEAMNASTASARLLTALGGTSRGWSHRTAKSGHRPTPGYRHDGKGGGPRTTDHHGPPLAVDPK
jgi:hypothetical protein